MKFVLIFSLQIVFKKQLIVLIKLLIDYISTKTMSTITCLCTLKRDDLLSNFLRSFPVFLFLIFHFCSNGQIIERYAGVGGQAGYSGDGGSALSAKFSYPGRTAI